VLFLAADLHVVGAGGDGVDEGGFVVQLVAELVEVGHFLARAALDAALVRLDFAQDELDQGGLAGAVGADQAQLVAAQDAGGEVADQGLSAVAVADVEELGDHLAGAVARRQGEAHLAQAFPPRRPFPAQGFQAAHAAFVAGAARLDALADPDFLLLPELVELAVLGGLHFQLLGLPGLVGGEVALVLAQLAPVQFDDAVGHPVQEGPVVGDEQQGAGEFRQQGLQPFDGGEVQVVGGLVQQQQFRFRGQGAGQGDALLGAAGQGVHQGVGIQAQAGDGFLHPAVEAPGVVDFQFVGQAGQFGQGGGIATAGGMGGGVVGGQQAPGRPGAFRHGLEYAVAGL
jgi:hypothetical protein